MKKRENKTLLKALGVFFSLAFIYLASKVVVGSQLQMLLFALPIAAIVPLWLMRSVFKEFTGLYNKKLVIEKIESFSSNSEDVNKPLAVILVSESDWNGVGFSDLALSEYYYNSKVLKDNGYDVIYKVIAEDSESLSNDMKALCKDRKAALLMLHGHGYSEKHDGYTIMNRIHMGNKMYSSVDVMLDVSKDYMVDNGKVIFSSCLGDALAQECNSRVSSGLYKKVEYVGSTEKIRSATYLSKIKNEEGEDDLEVSYTSFKLF